MSYFTISFLWHIISLITIHSSSNHPTHYKSQHFHLNNPNEWSSTTTSSYETISCTINIPSLCLYYIPSTPGFHLFYGNKMLNFLQDTNWSTITVTNNLDNEQYNNILLQLIHTNISTKLSHKYQYTPQEYTPIEMIETPMDIHDIYTNNTNDNRRRLGSGSYTWKGCYKDTSRRALRNGPHNWHYSIDRCYRACKRYRYFALQAGSWCSCENSWAHATKYGRGRGCPRSHKGGGWRNDVFAIRRSSRTTRTRRRRRTRTRWHRCGMKCKLKKAINKLRRRYRRESRDAKMRSRVYNRLYRFGRILGESMRTGNFGGLCGLTGECDMEGQPWRRRRRGYGRGRGCGGGMRSRCPTRFRTYLGPPHVVGKVSYILGSPPVGTAPSGWAGGQGFGMQGLGTSPMYPGMMGGMMGMQAPGMWPGMMGGYSGHPQAMIGDMGYGKKKEEAKEKSKEKSKEKKTKKKVEKKAKKVKKAKKKARRRLMDVYSRDMMDVRLKKCVYVSGNEQICGVYYYIDGHVEVEYNYNVDEVRNNKKNNKEMEYYEGNVWLWNGEEDVECNSDLLDYIGYIVCIQMDENGKDIKALLIDDYDIDDTVVKTIDLMDNNKENWDEIYEINGMEKHKKICEYVNRIELCFEMMKYNDRRIEITTQRLLPKDVDVIDK